MMLSEINPEAVPVFTVPGIASWHTQMVRIHTPHRSCAEPRLITSKELCPGICVEMVILLLSSKNLKKVKMHRGSGNYFSSFL